MTSTAVKNAHCVQLCKSLWALQQSGQLCDLSLRVGDDVISAHRTVLAASAAFFLQRESAHSDDNKESATIINVSETSATLVQDIVRFVYTGVLAVNTENVDGIYDLCKKWHIDSAKVLCERFKTLRDKQQSTDADCETANRRHLRKRPLSVEVAEHIPSEMQSENSDEDTCGGEEALGFALFIKEEDDSKGFGGERINNLAKKRTTPNQILEQIARKRGRPPGMNKKRGRGRPRKIKREEVDGDEETELVITDMSPVKKRPFRKCHKCHEEFESPEDLTTHKLSCSQFSPIRPYTIRKCRKCKEMFDSPQECRLHRETCEGTADEGDGEQADGGILSQRDAIKRVYRKCHRCHEAFDTPAELLEHKEECRNANISKPYAIRKCRKCKETFETPEDCAVHQLQCTVATEKPPPERFKYKCDQCSKAFTKKRTLESHVMTKHCSGDKGPEYFFCKIEGCMFKTLYPYYMQKHIHWTHAKDKAIMCDICGAMSKNEYYLKAHKRIRHSEAEIFDCDVCGMKIRTQQALKMHKIRVHGVEQPTKLCSYCTYITYTKSELDRHMFQKHDIPLPSGKTMLMCSYCEYKAITKSVMDEHVLRHTADKRRYPCDQCSKRFITEKDLKSHAQVHNPERKRYKCPHCDYSTPYGRYKLRTHVETMHEKKDYKPWVCDICNYRTNIKGNLTLHLKNTHKLRVETKTRVIHKLDPICTTGDGSDKSGGVVPPGKGRGRRGAVPAEPAHPEQLPAEQVPEQVMGGPPHILLPAQVSMLVQQEQHHPQHQQHNQQLHQQQQQHQHEQHHVEHHTPQLPYTLLGQAPTRITLPPLTQRAAYKPMTSVAEKEAKFACELQPVAHDPLHPLGDASVLGLEGGVRLSSSGLEHLGLHGMATVSGGHLAGGQPQGESGMGFSMVPPGRMLGPTEVSGAQSMYMDTIINSLVSHGEHPL